MNSRNKANDKPVAPRTERKRGGQQDLQPAPTGANRGSPAAPVMQQFVKTKAERNGRS